MNGNDILCELRQSDYPYSLTVSDLGAKEWMRAFFGEGCVYPLIDENASFLEQCFKTDSWQFSTYDVSYWDPYEDGYSRDEGGLDLDEAWTVASECSTGSFRGWVIRNKKAVDELGAIITAAYANSEGFDDWADKEFSSPLSQDDLDTKVSERIIADYKRLSTEAKKKILASLIDIGWATVR